MNDPSQAEDDISGIGTDPVAFEVFYRRHLEAVSRFVARRVDDPHLAADLTADVFLAVIESAAGYRPDRVARSAGCSGWPATSSATSGVGRPNDCG